MGTNERKRRIFRRQLLLLLVIVVAAFFGVPRLLSLYTERDRIAVWFTLPSGTTSERFYVRKASTESERRRGLKYVRPEELGTNRGMLFEFPEQKRQTFWMEDTPSPLDIIFIDDNRKVVGILRDVPPYSREIRSVEAESKFVLEVPAGAARRAGITEGAVIEVDGGLAAGR